jgi:hypothetical protein
MARKGLPKKYAKMGFKRGWAAYKRAKRTPTRKTYTKRKRGVYTARRRSYKRYYRRARGGGGGAKQIIDGVIVGAAGAFLNGKIPYAAPIATLAVGFFRHNATLKTLGGIQIAQALMGGAGLGNGGGVR